MGRGLQFKSYDFEGQIAIISIVMVHEVKKSVAAIVYAIVVTILFCSTSMGQVGKEIDLVLKDLRGSEQRLTAFRGRIVILNFWATYCIPCRKEMPDLAAIQNEFAALGVQVIGASTDEVENRAEVLQFVKETKVNFPIWMGATTADMMRFGLGAALPGTVVIGRDGRVAKVISGVVNQADLKKQIELMLASGEKLAAKEREQTARQKRSDVSSVPS